MSNLTHTVTTEPNSENAEYPSADTFYTKSGSSPPLDVTSITECAATLKHTGKRYTFSIGTSAKSTKWTPTELTHEDLVNFLMEHNVGPKDGKAFVPGKLNGDGRRRNNNVQELHALVLDIDDGTPTNELVAKVKELGCEAVIHTTHSHQNDTTSIRKEAVDRHRGRYPGGSVAELLSNIKGFRPEIVEDAKIIETNCAHGKRDEEFVFKHSPCPKHRVVFPLAKPFLIGDHLETAAQMWVNLRIGLLTLLGLSGDKQTDDLSRLYFLPRHAAGKAYDRRHLEGELLSLGDIEVPQAPETASTASQEHTSLAQLVDGRTGNGLPQGLYGRLAKAYSDYIEDPADYLVAQGYELIERFETGEVAARLLPPTSSTGKPGVVLLRSDDGNLRVYSHHGSDALNEDDAERETAHDILELIARFEFDQPHWDVAAKRELAMRTAAIRLMESYPQMIKTLFAEKDDSKWLKQMANSSTLDLIENTAFSKVTGKYIDLDEGADMIAQSLNTVWANKLDGASAARLFAKSDAKQIVFDRSWWPGKSRIFHMEGRLYANPYKPTDMVANPRPGDVGPYLELAKKLIPDDYQREYLFDLFAYTLQHQDKKINVHPMLGGAPGIGKDTLIQPLLMGIGEAHVSQIGESAAASDFDDHIVETKVVVVQEVSSFLGRRDFENEMKMKLACPPNTLLANPKGRPKISVPNNHTWIFMTNHRTPVNISEGDRRLFCIWCEMKTDEAKRLSEEGYYSDLYGWLGCGGNEAVVADLLDRDLSKFNPSDRAPMTNWKELIQSESGGAGSKGTRGLIECGHEALKRDLITIWEIRNLLFHGEAKISNSDIQDSLGEAGAEYLGKVQKKIDGKVKQERVWCLHNHERYKDMTSANRYECWWNEHTRDFDDELDT